jgi:uncharacterized protein (TIGR00369 family)
MTLTDDAAADDAGRPMKRFKGFMQTLGARLTAWGPDHATIEIEVSEIHRNGINVVHGGVMASLIDTAGAHAAIFCANPGHTRKAMTISLNVNLVGNIPDGVLIAEARVRKAGTTIFVSACDVHDGDGNLLATGEVVGRYGRGSHLPEGVPSETDIGS